MFLLINKPQGVTSHDVIYQLRRITGEKRIGHAGTLDPNATGLLVVGIGRESTKNLGSISKDTSKTYIAEICLGEVRDTDDVEGKVVKKSSKTVKMTEVKDIFKIFVGKQKQTPPIYSAIKVKGQKAYNLARKGKKIQLESRDIKISKISLISFKFPLLTIKVEVSSGTYIRALARDIGQKLGCGAYLRNLKRTQVGSFSIDVAVELNDLTKDNWQKYALQLKQ